MNRFFEGLLDLFYSIDLKLGRIALGVASMIIATIFLFLGPQFDRPSYSELSKYAPQWVYGVAFGICGAMAFLRSVRGIPVTSGPYACGIAFVQSFLWCAFCAGIAKGLYPPPGMLAANFVIALLSLLVLFRCISKRA